MAKASRRTGFCFSIRQAWSLSPCSDPGSGDCLGIWGWNAWRFNEHLERPFAFRCRDGSCYKFTDSGCSARGCWRKCGSYTHDLLCKIPKKHYRSKCTQMFDSYRHTSRSHILGYQPRVSASGQCMGCNWQCHSREWGNALCTRQSQEEVWTCHRIRWVLGTFSGSKYSYRGLAIRRGSWYGIESRWVWHVWQLCCTPFWAQY